MTKSSSHNFFFNKTLLKSKNCSLTELCFSSPSFTRSSPLFDPPTISANKHTLLIKKNRGVFKKSRFSIPNRHQINSFIRKVYRRHPLRRKSPSSSVVKPAGFERIDCTRLPVSSSSKLQSESASPKLTSVCTSISLSSKSASSNTTAQAVHRVLSREIESLRNKQSNKTATSSIDHRLSSSNLLQRLIAYTVDLVPSSDPVASSTTGLSSEQLSSIPSVSGYRRRRKMHAPRQLSLSTGLNTNVATFYGGEPRHGQVDLSVPDFGGSGSLRGGASILSPSSRLLAANDSTSTASPSRAQPTNGGPSPPPTANSQRSASQSNCSTATRTPLNPPVNGHSVVFTPRTLKPQSPACTSRASIPNRSGSGSSSAAASCSSSSQPPAVVAASSNSSTSCSTSSSCVSTNGSACDSSAAILHPAVTVCARSSINTRWPSVPSVRCGISNQGNNCYMNSVLQVLTYTAPLFNYLTTHLKKCMSK